MYHNEDIVNLWNEDSDFNVVRTWLVGGTGGQTYSIFDRFLQKIKIDEDKFQYDFCDIEVSIDEIIGWKHDYKLDDPSLDSCAWKIVNELDEFIKNVNENPEKYFSLTKCEQARIENCKKCIHRFACKKNKPDYKESGYCEEFEIKN